MICSPLHARNLVESCPLAVDIDAFVRAGVLDSNNDVTGTVSVAEHSMAFAVQHRGSGAPLVCFACAVETVGERREVRATVPVVSTAQRLGSRRWWSCPSCGRRARIIYLASGSDEMGCRVCGGLVHRSAARARGRRPRVEKNQDRGEQMASSSSGANFRRTPFIDPFHDYSF
jgi:hypothetical protein